jgi:hypothetical protein
LTGAPEAPSPSLVGANAANGGKDAQKTAGLDDYSHLLNDLGDLRTSSKMSGQLAGHMLPGR